MATTTRPPTRSAAASAPPPARRSAGARLGRWFADHLIALLGALVLLYMFLPISVVLLLSFNDPVSRRNYTFQEFTLDNWTDPCGGAPAMCSSLSTSLQIAFLATVASTVLGTLMAFALGRHRFAGRSATNLLIFLPMATPEVVMGSSLLTLFVALQVQLGFTTILVAHIMFCLSFVVVTVKARIAGMDPRLEQAAMDLYASEWQTFRRITLPLVFPGIAAAAMLAFSLSFDDFIITNFNSGRTVTFPVFIWGAAQQGVPPQVNVIGSLMFLIALALVLGGQFVRGRRAR